jgi:hypothetical protein
VTKRNSAAGRKAQVMQLLKKIDQGKKAHEEICRSCRLCGFCEAQPTTPPA